MPPIRAACARFIPSSTAANDKRRRLWFPILVAAASRRSSPAEKSLRTLTAAGMARILPAPWNQLSPKYGIPVSHKRWPLVLEPIRKDRLRFLVWHLSRGEVPHVEAGTSSGGGPSWPEVRE